MRLEDGTVLENIASEDIQVTSASLAEGHKHNMNRDKDEEEVEEGYKSYNRDRTRTTSKALFSRRKKVTKEGKQDDKRRVMPLM